MKTSKSTAARLKDDLNLATENLVQKGYTFHHSSIARGYESVVAIRIEAYDGRWGQGFIVHLPTLISFIKGNSYHRVIYFVKPNSKNSNSIKPYIKKFTML